MPKDDSRGYVGSNLNQLNLDDKGTYRLLLLGNLGNHRADTLHTYHILDHNPVGFRTAMGTHYCSMSSMGGRREICEWVTSSSLDTHILMIQHRSPQSMATLESHLHLLSSI